MKKFTTVLFLGSSLTFAQTYDLKKSEATYAVSHLLKTVKGENKELKGKIQCNEIECEFLIAAYIKSFVSSDGNRDQNMLQVTEADQYPLTTTKGKFTKSDWDAQKGSISAEVEFHGIKKNYPIQFSRNAEQFKANFVLDLEAHKIKRPSLFGMAIKNEVPMTFVLEWQSTK